MNPDQMAIQVRPRSNWETIDLGFVMARHWFFPLVTLWFCTALPVAFVVQLLFAQTPWAVILLFWWLKPLYETALTFWMSRALFGERLNMRSTFKHWRQIFLPRLVANLTWNRLDTSRSYAMPVTVLEGLKGQPRKDRLRILGRRRQGASWLTIVGYHFESVLMISIMLFVLMLIPEELRWLEWDTFLIGEGRVEQTLQQLAYLLAMAVIAPFYVAAGFALYLSRRTELEAWDIELRFRRIAERAEKKTNKPKVGVLAMLLVLVLTPLLLVPQTTEAMILDRQEAQNVVEQVLADKDFGELEKKGNWHFVGSTKEKSTPGWFGEFIKGVAGFFKGIATIGETLLWGGFGLLIVAVIYWIYKNRQWLGGLVSRVRRKPKAPQVEIFGLAVSPESLPNDVVSEALRLLGAGDSRGALSLLYRGALSKFIHRDLLEIPPSATEGECQRLVDQTVARDESGLFDRLTKAWIGLAYGHFDPVESELKQLCDEWRRIYQPNPQEQAEGG